MFEKSILKCVQADCSLVIQDTTMTNSNKQQQQQKPKSSNKALLRKWLRLRKFRSTSHNSKKSLKTSMDTTMTTLKNTCDANKSSVSQYSEITLTSVNKWFSDEFDSLELSFESDSDLSDFDECSLETAENSFSSIESYDNVFEPIKLKRCKFQPMLTSSRNTLNVSNAPSFYDNYKLNVSTSTKNGSSFDKHHRRLLSSTLNSRTSLNYRPSPNVTYLKYNFNSTRISDC